MRLDDTGASVDRSDDDPPQPATVVIFKRWMQTFDSIIDSKAKTDRFAHLLRLVLRMWDVTVCGAVAISVLLATSVPWWVLASMLGITVIGRGGAALVRRRCRPAPIPPTPPVSS